MTRRNPTTTTRQDRTTEPAPGLFDFDPELAGSISEFLRKTSLGLTTALVAARAYFPSEAISEADSGRGMVWVFMILIATGLGLASLWIGGATRLRVSWADWAVVTLMVLVGLSATWAPERRIGINLGWDWGGLALAYLLLRNLPRSRAESAAVAGVLVATAVAVAVYGLYQAGVEFPRLKAFFKANPVVAMRQAGVDPNSPAAQAFQKRLEASTEPFATFALANSLAGYLTAALAVALGVVCENLVRRDGRPSRSRAILFAAPPLLCLLVCLLLTKSRSAWIGLIVAIAVLAWRFRGRARTRTLALGGLAAAGILAVLIGVATAAKQLDIQVLTQSTKSMRYRWEYWQGAWGVIKERPWGGWGPGNFKGPYLRHKLAVSSEEIGDPHNFLLEVWATAGLFALIALVIALGYGLRDILGPVTNSPEDTATPEPTSKARQPTWLVISGGLGGLFAVFFVGAFDPFRDPDLLMRWAMLAGGWALAVVCGRPLWRRIPLPAAAIGAGVIALSVNLLAAGGIGMPAVALMLWSLLALGQNLREDRACGQERRVGARFAAFALAIVWSGLTGSFVGAVSPFWRAEALMAEGEEELSRPMPDFDGAQDHFFKAAQEDKSASRSWIALAELTYLAWRDRQALPGDQAWKQLSGDFDHAVEPPRNPNSLTVETRRSAIGATILARGALPAASAELIRRHRVKAAARVCGLHPTNALYRADLADALAATNQFSVAAREAREALRLDRVTPHEDKRLPDVTRKRLVATLPEWEGKKGG